MHPITDLDLLVLRLAVNRRLRRRHSDSALTSLLLGHHQGLDENQQPLVNPQIKRSIVSYSRVPGFNRSPLLSHTGSLLQHRSSGSGSGSGSGIAKSPKKSTALKPHSDGNRIQKSGGKNSDSMRRRKIAGHGNWVKSGAEDVEELKKMIGGMKLTDEDGGGGGGGGGKLIEQPTLGVPDSQQISNESSMEGMLATVGKKEWGHSPMTVWKGKTFEGELGMRRRVSFTL